MARHPLLHRQLKRHIGDAEIAPELQGLLDEISEAYYRNDRSQTLFERALDLTSDEFLAREADNVRELHRLSGATEQVEQLLIMLNTTVEISTDALLLLDGNGEPVLFSERLPEYLGADDEFLACLNTEELQQHIEGNAVDASEFLEQYDQIQQDPTIATCCTVNMNNGATLECHSLPYPQDEEHMGRVWNFRRLA